MPDLRNDPAFVAAVAAARQAIGELASRGIPDAEALVARSAGWNNLQGHAHSLIPLAVLYARSNYTQLQAVRSATILTQAMTGGSQEARNRSIWRVVKRSMITMLAGRGSDIISEQIANGRPQTARQIANTYLSSSFGGGQSSGGAGNTVIKRTLKLLAHIFIA